MPKDLRTQVLRAPQTIVIRGHPLAPNLTLPSSLLGPPQTRLIKLALSALHENILALDSSMGSGIVIVFLLRYMLTMNVVFSIFVLFVIFFEVFAGVTVLMVPCDVWRLFWKHVGFWGFKGRGARVLWDSVLPEMNVR